MCSVLQFRCGKKRIALRAIFGDPTDLSPRLERGSGGDAEDQQRNVVGAAAFQRGLHEGSAGFRRSSGSHRERQFLFPHQTPKSIGAQYQRIAFLESEGMLGRVVLPDTPEHPFALQEGDALVLCTDGLWSLVGEQELALSVRSGTPAEACVNLVQTALERGGPDNITLLVLRISA